MFTHSDYSHLEREYLQAQAETGKKLKKIWGIFLILSLIISAAIAVLIPGQFSDGETAWILPTFGGSAILVTLIGFLVSRSYVSEKPFFRVVFPRIYEKMLFDESLSVEYTAYEKGNREFNKKGGLFTRMASVKIRRHVKSQTEKLTPIDIYDCLMTTSDGKNQQTHFDGTYLVLHQSLNTITQVRTNGSPHLKGTKYKRRKEIENVKVYTDSERLLDSKDQQLVEFYNSLIRDENIKRVYISSLRDETHLAIWYKKHPARKSKVMNLEVVNNYYSVFKEEFSILQKLSELGYY